VRQVFPTNRSGAWIVEVGLRQRACRCLELTSEKAREVTDFDARRQDEPSLVPLEHRSTAFADFQMYCDGAVVFAAMAVEGFINFYGTVRLGEAEFVQHFEHLRPVAEKLRKVLAACNSPLDSNSDILIVVRDLANARNALVHPKTKEIAPESFGTQPGKERQKAARESVESMERFFELFLQIDPDARLLARGA
jgi:hypothetical protein